MTCVFQNQLIVGLNICGPYVIILMIINLYLIVYGKACSQKRTPKKHIFYDEIELCIIKY